ncbi:hypothetical protein Scep_006709 [Stephania cephalantha]|uniref:Replication factor A C-terminal domain-containing protein n=1 Tax=Stephania cephalantha TaxID=152367 RepID=A0AAP0PL33_9MAGN
MSIPIHFRNPIVRPSQRRPLVTIAKINSMLNDQALLCLKVAIAVPNMEQSLWFMSCHNCSKFTNAEVGEVFYCTNCNHEDAHDTPRARIEVELTDESGALKVVAYGSIVEDIISLNAQEIMTKTMAGEACNLMGASKLLKYASFFMSMFKRISSLTIQSLDFFLVEISPINVEVGNLDLNGDNGNIDGPLVANAQTSLCGSARLKETNGEVIVETCEVILHTVASATTSSKRETSNFTSRSSKLLKPAVVSLESASTSSG